jgi:hypothetical protein
MRSGPCPRAALPGHEVVRVAGLRSGSFATSSVITPRRCRRRTPGGQAREQVLGGKVAARQQRHGRAPCGGRIGTPFRT